MYSWHVSTTALLSRRLSPSLKPIDRVPGSFSCFCVAMCTIRTWWSAATCFLEKRFCSCSEPLRKTVQYILMFTSYACALQTKGLNLQNSMCIGEHQLRHCRNARKNVVHGERRPNKKNRSKKGVMHTCTERRGILSRQTLRTTLCTVSHRQDTRLSHHVHGGGNETLISNRTRKLALCS